MLQSRWIQPFKRFYNATANAKPYFVARTVNNALPVYSDIKKGGTLYLTIIRRVEGDAQALEQDIAKLFPESARPSFKTKRINNHVVIKGSYVNEVKEWLASQGF